MKHAEGFVPFSFLLWSKNKSLHWNLFERYPGWGPRPKSRYVQTVPDEKCLCPDPPRRKVSTSRPSETESAYVQTFVRSKFFVRSTCVQKSPCPDSRAFIGVSRSCNFDRTTPSLCVHFGLDISTFGLEPQLGYAWLNKICTVAYIKKLGYANKLKR